MALHHLSVGDCRAAVCSGGSVRNAGMALGKAVTLE